MKLWIRDNHHLLIGALMMSLSKCQIKSCKTNNILLSEMSSSAPAVLRFATAYAPSNVSYAHCRLR